MRSSLFVIVVAGLTACTTETIRKESASAGDAGDGPSSTESAAPGAGDIVSGSRLRARWFVADDGAKSFNGWLDSERGEPCYFQRASDGRMRCLPQALAHVDSTFFSDSSCRKPLVSATKGCSAPSVAAASGAYCGMNEGDGTRVFEVGAAFRGASLYSLSSGSCDSTPSAPYLEGRDFYLLGGEISPDSFVGGEEESS